MIKIVLKYNVRKELLNLNRLKNRLNFMCRYVTEPVKMDQVST